MTEAKMKDKYLTEDTKSPEKKFKNMNTKSSIKRIFKISKEITIPNFFN